MIGPRLAIGLLGLAAMLISQRQSEAQPPQSVTFRARPPVTGQRIWRHLTVFANTSTTYEQSGQKISQRHRNITNEQIRRLTVLQASERASTRVEVRYEKAQHTITERGHAPEVRHQPVAGKRYLVSRTNKERLLIQYVDGSMPSDEELEIVTANMQGIGRQNPLAQFLDGRQISIGQTVELPREAAADLVGWKSEYGRVQSVTLRLAELTELAGSLCAVFESKIQGTPLPDQDTTTKMLGSITVEISTCRTLATNLTATLDLSEERGPTGHKFTVSNVGTATIHSQARFLSDDTKLR